MKIVSIILSLFLLFTLSLSAEIKSVWVTAWELNDKTKIDELLAFCTANNISQIMVHTRYRGDALYIPNRIFDYYENNEPVSYTINDFDPLAYIIEAAEESEVEIHAWVTVFVVTPRDISHISENHIYYTNPDWITKDFWGNSMQPNSYEGAYLDPGIPQVHDYLIDVFSDIAVNYNLSGIHLDYIRYPDSHFGWAEKAVELYQNSSLSEAKEFHLWRQEQINRFVKRFYAEMKYINPDLIVSAAVISNQDRAVNKYSQNWTKWLDEGYLDYAYIMAYAHSDKVFADELTAVEKWNDKVVVGLRAWTENNEPLPLISIVSKMNILREKQFAGLALFSYSTNGLRLLCRDNSNDNPFFNSISSLSLPATSEDNLFFFGNLQDEEENYLSDVKVELQSDDLLSKNTITDNNGFFYFFRLPPGTYWLKVERVHPLTGNPMVNLSSNIELTKDYPNEKYHFVIPSLNISD